MVHLWDPQLGSVKAGVNYGDGPDPDLIDFTEDAGLDVDGDPPTLDNGDLEPDDVNVNLGIPWQE
ncbi:MULTISPECIES: hypothetical protein [unclassified Frankia]